LEFARGDRDRGIETLRSAVAQRDDYSPGNTILGQAYLELGNITEATSALERAVAQKPDNVYALKSLITLYLRLGDDRSQRMAKNYLAAALRFAPRDAQLRDFDDELGKPKEAIERRLALRSVDPKNVENLQRLAMLYVKDRQTTRAIDVLKDLTT